MGEEGGEAEADLSLTSRLIDDLTNDELESLLCCAALGWAEYVWERYESAQRHLQRGIDVAAGSGQGHYSALCLVGQCFTLTTLGRLVEARETGQAALEVARQSGSSLILVLALASQALATTGVEKTAAVELAEERHAVAQSADPGIVTAITGRALAAALVEAGNSREAVPRLLEAAGGEDLPRAWPAARNSCYEVLTRAELARGRLGDARRWAERAGAAAATLDLALPQASRNGRHTGDDAAEAASSVVARMDAARSRPLAGRALARAGHRERATVELDRAVDEFAACGRRAWSTKVGDSPPSRPPGAHPMADGVPRPHRRHAEPTPEPGGAARQRGQDRPRDRRRALLERTDGGEPRRSHLRQAGSLVACGAGHRGRQGGRAAVRPALSPPARP